MSKYKEKVDAGEDPCDFYEKLDPDAAERELLMTGIRILEGVEKKKFNKSLIQKKEEISKLIDEEYIKETNDRLLLTEKGLLFYDDVAQELI